MNITPKTSPQKAISAYCKGCIYDPLAGGSHAAQIDINKCLANEIRKRTLAKKGRADGVRAVLASPEGNRQERRMYAKRAKKASKNF